MPLVTDDYSYDDYYDYYDEEPTDESLDGDPVITKLENHSGALNDVTVLPTDPPEPLQDLKLSVQIRTVESALKGSLTWNNPLGLQVEMIRWVRTSCQVQDTLPECPLESTFEVEYLDEKTSQVSCWYFGIE